MELNEKLIDGLTDEEIEFLKSQDDIVSGIKAYSAAAEAIKEMNPAFRGKTLSQLNDNKDFQQALKEYRLNNPSTTTAQGKIEALKSIIPTTFAITNNKLSNEIIKEFLNQGEKPFAVMNVDKKMKSAHIIR